MTELEWCAEFEHQAIEAGFTIVIRWFPYEDCIAYTLEREGARKGIGVAWRTIAPAVALRFWTVDWASP